jgi:hypothetical protein
MNANWAEENLQVIRTLMENSAVYRRALAPIFLMVGTIGLGAALVGMGLHLNQERGFTGLWLGAALVVIAVTLFMTRRQALREREAFWSAPTRRVVLALAPALITGALITLICSRRFQVNGLAVLVPVWTVLYGCALNATGALTPRAVRWLGCAFMAAGVAFVAMLCLTDIGVSGVLAHGIMGATFGGLHLLCGLYLAVTGKGSNGS